MNLHKVELKYFLIIVIVGLMMNTTLKAQDAENEKKSHKVLGYYEQSELLGEVLLETDTTEVDGIKVKMESHYTINPTIELKVDEGSSYVIDKDSIIAITSFARINDRSRYKIKQNWDQSLDKYTRTVNSRTKELELPLLKSMYLTMFFVAPIDGVRTVYSEVFDKDFSLKKSSETKYRVTDHLNRTHTFEYDKDGKFKSAELTTATGIYTIKEIKE